MYTNAILTLGGASLFVPERILTGSKCEGFPWSMYVQIHALLGDRRPSGREQHWCDSWHHHSLTGCPGSSSPAHRCKGVYLTGEMWEIQQGTSIVRVGQMLAVAVKTLNCFTSLVLYESTNSFGTSCFLLLVFSKIVGNMEGVLCRLKIITPCSDFSKVNIPNK